MQCLGSKLDAVAPLVAEDEEGIASGGGEVLAKGGDELGGKRDGGLIFEQEREAFAELDDKAGLERARKIDLDEMGIGAGQSAGWRRLWSGHPSEDARSTAGE
ncbi:MAG: hypothetical protein EAZ42_04340 [Verrucomicrobia bacterium]|nr:MAG: hypothetical protein EAZ42_04340 [Verrucomicrobiota bacterium]